MRACQALSVAVERVTMRSLKAKLPTRSRRHRNSGARIWCAEMPCGLHRDDFAVLVERDQGDDRGQQHRIGQEARHQLGAQAHIGEQCGLPLPCTNLAASLSRSSICRTMTSISSTATTRTANIFAM
jgi:hypothetical protein